MMFDLTESVSVGEADPKDFGRVFEARRSDMFLDAFTFNLDSARTELVRESQRQLGRRLNERFTIRWFLHHNNSIIGWTYGFQSSADTFYMCNSAIESDYRGKGLYTALLPHIIQRVIQEGFDVITSKHAPSNNAVIIPKLKAGFMVNGIEIHDKFGTLVNLVYHANQTRNDFFKVRTGEKVPNPEIMKHLT